ncbi:hypothetical protein RUND412_009196 [Rhizina undulata]
MPFMLTDFDGTSNAHRWIKRLEATFRSNNVMPDDAMYPVNFVNELDVRLAGEAAMWADKHPTVSAILHSANVTMDDVNKLKTLFLARLDSEGRRNHLMWPLRSRPWPRSLVNHCDNTITKPQFSYRKRGLEIVLITRPVGF